MSSSILKILGCLFMLIDHIGFCLFPEISVFRIIGRLAFPIFAFQLSVGFKNTKNRKNYIVRMLIFSLISQLPFVLFRSAAGYSSFALNIGFTFFIALICLSIIEYSQRRNNLSPIFIVLVLVFLSEFLHVDYGFFGVITVIIFYLFDIRKNPLGLLLASVASTFVYVYGFMHSSIQFFMLLSLIILYFFNGQKGKNIKYLFYIFYPTHLLVLYLINIVM